MKIYVPSRGRFEARFLDGIYSPLAWVTPKLELVYVVSGNEYPMYRAALDKRRPETEVLPVGHPENLSQKRATLAKMIAVRNESIFCMCDDDLSLYIRKSDDSFQLRYPEPDEVDDLFLNMIPELLEDYPMVGVGAREGNNRIGDGPRPLLTTCTRSMRLYAFRTKDYLSIDANRLPEMADFDTTLQFLRRGQANAVINYYAQNQPQSQLKGGCSIYRTPATHDAVCRQLEALHPGFVKLRQKANLGGGDYGTRTEVTISWKKAYEEGCALRDL
jgi:hypothetical protein